MIIEIAGCTGSGKSSLCNFLLKYYISKGLPVSTPIEAFLGKRLGKHLHSESIQNLLFDIISFPWFLIGLKSHYKFIKNMIYIIKSRPGSFVEKALIFRSIVRKCGVYTFLRSKRFYRKMVFFDEGTIQCAHYALVSYKYTPSETDISTFKETVPKPDKLIYVEATLQSILLRIRQRSDVSRRINKLDDYDKEIFLSKTLQMFNRLNLDNFMKGTSLSIRTESHDYLDMYDMGDKILSFITS